MKARWIFALGLACLPVSLAAQTFTIHDHPQKAAYATPAEWLPVNSQCWFGDPDPVKASHIHIVYQPPMWANIFSWSTFDVPFTLQAHNTSGLIGIVQGEHIKSIKWDDTGTSELPVMQGPGVGLREWHGVATIDLSLGDDGFLHLFKFPLHGWAEWRIFTRTFLDRGRYLDEYAQASLYSLIDPTAPENPAPEQGNPGVHFRTSCVLWNTSPDGGGSPIAGELVTEISDYTPLDPIADTWTTVINGYNYTANPAFPLPNEQFELRLDPNLHHGVEGTTLRLDDIGPPTFTNKQMIGPLVLDPATMGPGAHTVMAIWRQPLGTLVPGVESLASVVVFPVTVAPGGPTTCTDPTATNVGGPLPCVFPQPQPPPPTTCQDPTATNIGGPLPCVFPPPPPPPPPPLTISCTGIGSGFLQIKADGTFSLTNTSGATSCK